MFPLEKSDLEGRKSTGRKEARKEGRKRNKRKKNRSDDGSRITCRRQAPGTCSLEAVENLLLLFRVEFLSGRVDITTTEIPRIPSNAHPRFRKKTSASVYALVYTIFLHSDNNRTACSEKKRYKCRRKKSDK